MPFVSTAQRAYLALHHPEIAHRWAKLTPKGKKLPKHKRKTTRAMKRHRKTLRKGSGKR